MKFSRHERLLLIATPGIGPLVVERLEQVGVDSLAALRVHGVDEVVDRICRVTGSSAWQNRRRALRRALDALEPVAPLAAVDQCRALFGIAAPHSLALGCARNQNAPLEWMR